METVIVNVKCSEIFCFNIQKNISEKDIEAGVKVTSIRLDSATLPVDFIVEIITKIGSLSSVITAIIAILAYKGRGEITITLKNGCQIKVPVNTPKDKIVEYIEKVKELSNSSQDIPPTSSI